MRVLLLGGGGYVGQVLEPVLRQRRHDVVVFDRYWFVNPPVGRARVELRTVTVDDLYGFDAVVNLSGLSNDPTADFAPDANRELNTHMAIRLAQLARTAKVGRFIQASSCSIYDGALPDGTCDEDTPVHPTAYYASSKLAAEGPIIDLARRSFLPLVFRKGTIHGFSPRMRFDLVVNAMVASALSRGEVVVHSGGQMWRPVIDVRDVAVAYADAVENDRIGVWNLLTHNVQVSGIADRVIKVMAENNIEVRRIDVPSPGKVRSYRVSGDRLNPRSSLSLSQSVRDLVASIRHAGITDFANPRYHNIEWLRLMIEAQAIVDGQGAIL